MTHAAELLAHRAKTASRVARIRARRLTRILRHSISLRRRDIADVCVTEYSTGPTSSYDCVTAYTASLGIAGESCTVTVRVCDRWLAEHCLTEVTLTHTATRLVWQGSHVRGQKSDVDNTASFDAFMACVAVAAARTDVPGT